MTKIGSSTKPPQAHDARAQATKSADGPPEPAGPTEVKPAEDKSDEFMPQTPTTPDTTLKDFEGRRSGAGADPTGSTAGQPESPLLPADGSGSSEGTPVRRGTEQSVVEVEETKSGEDYVRDNADNPHLQGRMDTLQRHAEDPEAFQKLTKDVFGVDGPRSEKLRKQIESGDMSWVPTVHSGALEGIDGAFVGGTNEVGLGTKTEATKGEIYIDSRLAGDDQARVFTEEVGHAIDHQLKMGTRDRAGDEGAVFNHVLSQPQGTSLDEALATVPDSASKEDYGSQLQIGTQVVDAEFASGPSKPSASVKAAYQAAGVPENQIAWNYQRSDLDHRSLITDLVDRSQNLTEAKNLTTEDWGVLSRAYETTFGAAPKHKASGLMTVQETLNLRGALNPQVGSKRPRVTDEALKSAVGFAENSVTRNHRLSHQSLKTASQTYNLLHRQDANGSSILDGWRTTNPAKAEAVDASFKNLFAETMGLNRSSATGEQVVSDLATSLAAPTGLTNEAAGPLVQQLADNAHNLRYGHRGTNSAIGKRWDGNLSHFDGTLTPRSKNIHDSVEAVAASLDGFAAGDPVAQHASAAMKETLTTFKRNGVDISSSEGAGRQLVLELKGGAGNPADSGIKAEYDAFLAEEFKNPMNDVLKKVDGEMLTEVAAIQNKYHGSGNPQGMINEFKAAVTEKVGQFGKAAKATAERVVGEAGVSAFGKSAATAAKWLEASSPIIDAAFIGKAIQEDYERDDGQATSTISTVGGLEGAFAGAALGSVGGPIGTFIGGAAGYFGGESFTKWALKWASDQPIDPDAPDVSSEISEPTPGNFSDPDVFAVG